MVKKPYVLKYYDEVYKCGVPIKTVDLGAGTQNYVTGKGEEYDNTTVPHGALPWIVSRPYSNEKF